MATLLTHGVVGAACAGLLVALATASHGVLDAATSGGLGVGFLVPLSERRWFLPWRPLLVSPLSAEAFFSARGLRILAREVLCVWLPLALCLAAGTARRRAAVAERGA